MRCAMTPRTNRLSVLPDSHRSAAKFSAPYRGVGSPPGQELLGVITSHGPSRESYSPSRKSRGTAAAIAVSAADETLSAQRVRAALSSPAGAPALLQPGMP